MKLDEFWNHKNQELAFLERFAGSAQDRIMVADFEAFVHSVNTLRKRILLCQVERAAVLNETSPVGPGCFSSPSGPVTYDYQRYNLRRVDVQWLQELYFTDTEGRFSDGLLFACGMSAIAALYSVFSRRAWKQVQFSPIPYFESNLLAKRFFENITFDQANDQFTSDRDVLWLDTSSLIWPKFPEQAGSIRLIVVDTTLVEPDSVHTTQWIHESAHLKCPLVLVRSHMKLDSFGLEVGRLGSIVVIAPDNNSDETEELIKELLQARSGFGTGFNLINLYPWLGNQEFADLTRLRTIAIRRVTQLLYSALIDIRRSGDRYEVLPSKSHSIFLVIQTNIDVGSGGNRQDGLNPFQGFALSLSIAEYCSRTHLPMIAAGSLGLDRITVNDFVNFNNGLHEVRVAGADIPHYLIPAVAANIREAIVDFTRKIHGT